MFSYGVLKTLDYRDLLAFYREAQRKELEKSLNLLTLVRTAMASKEDYAKTVSEFKTRIREIQMVHREVLKENWDGLKKRG